MNFRYDGVPTLCFICGMIGHGDKLCEKMFDTQLVAIEKPYGAWMKAEPRRRNHIMRAKWLRQGGKSPVAFPVEQSDDGGRKMVTIIDAVKDHNPVNLGNIPDKTTSLKQTGGGVCYVI